MSRRLACAIPLILVAAIATAEQPLGVGYNSYGFPGLIDMPAAGSRPDGELAFTTSWFRNNLRNTLTFQVMPRLSGSFRYSSLTDIDPTGGAGAPPFQLYDRSFSVHFQLADETARRPGIAIGINDFLGTGIYGSEYVVISKTVAERLRLTGGIGWGRLAGVGSFRNPLSILSDRFDTRPGGFTGPGGQVELGELFRGPAALFGGVEYQATDRLRLTLEYSSDAYPYESPSAFDRRSPFNFGLSYQWRPGTTVEAQYLYGSELGVQVTFALNPKEPPAHGGLDKAPPPVVPRNAATAAELGWGSSGADWAASPAALDGVERRATRALAQTGLLLHGMSLTPGAVRVEVENATYRSQAQAVGRAARALTGVLPPSVEVITVVLVTNGIAASQVTLRRSDLEALEHDLDNSWSSFARARIEAASASPSPRAGLYPRWDGGFAPYITPSFFDPDDPVRADIGVQFQGRYEFARGWVVQGLARKKIIGNLDQSTRPSNSVLPRVRSDFNIYDREGDPALVELTLNRFFQPGTDIYGRVSLGYLESMFAGVSGELLWKPVASDFALGVELNWVRQRDFDQRFGLQDYSVATGHVSAYYDFGNGFTGQMDVGRYLAGDWGATVALDRRFRNGWTIGAFATKTDVSSAEFGEGSFDKGIRLTIPLDWISGQPDRRDYGLTLRPVQRDGGARLIVSNRLYEMINDSHQTGLQENWGRFWR